MLFNKPRWQPEEFQLNNAEQEAFYRKVLTDYVPFIILFHALAKYMGASRAGKLMGGQVSPGEGYRN
jgi:hypothetical protein